MTSDHNKEKITDQVAYITEMERRGEVVDHTQDERESRDNYTDITENTILMNTFVIKAENKVDRFDHNKFSKWLINESGEHFVTLEDSADIHYYGDGIYKEGGEAKIIKLLENIMGGYLMTIRARNEVIGHIRALTTVKRDAFDNNDDVIVMNNGIYRMSTEELCPHNPKYLAFRKLNISYIPNATCPTIDKFITESAEPHRVAAIYEIMGYALLPNKRLKKAIILVGPSDTGKTTVMELMERFVGGELVVDINPIVLASYAHASYRLYGKLVNRIDDLGETPITETGLLKTVISSSSIEANQKGGAQFSFSPKVLMVFGCNTVPVCSDPYLMDKFDILKFSNVRDKSKGKPVNRGLIDDMSTPSELSGLFNKAMCGMKVAIENDEFTGSYTLEDRRKAYKYLSNPIARFVGECCDMSDNEAETTKKIFRKAYVEWSKINDLRVVSVGDQTTYLQDCGVVLSKLGSGDDREWSYVGIELHVTSNFTSKSRNDSSTPNIPLRPTNLPIVGSVKNKDNIFIEPTIGKTLGHIGENDQPIVKDDLDVPPKKLDVIKTTAKNQVKKIYDGDTDSKLKHAVGKAITKSDTMGAEVSTIVECYPGSITSTEIREMLEERGKSLGINERYGKWYV